LIHGNECFILTASKRETNKNLNENFKAFLEKNTQDAFSINLQIQIKTPDQAKGLQLADALSWALYQKYEKNILKYYQIIQNNIADEFIFFK